MIEVRQAIFYFLGLTTLACVLSACAIYAGLEGVQYVPAGSPAGSHVSAAVEKGTELANDKHVIARSDVPPVWIAPTQKYDYDPKLMIVKPREERLKEAELKRKQEAENYLDKQQRAARKAQQKVAQQHKLRQHPIAYAYQPEVQPAFGIFSPFQ